MIKLILPYPPSELNPNKILHWTKKAKLKTIQHKAGLDASQIYNGAVGNSDIKLSIMFYAKTKRHYDLDNALSACKSLLDGIASGLGVNDKQFRPITIDRGKSCKENPRVEIEIG